jgi:hypothetical protein
MSLGHVLRFFEHGTTHALVLENPSVRISCSASKGLQINRLNMSSSGMIQENEP